MGDVIKMEDYRAEFERRELEKLERRKRHRKRLSGSQGDVDPKAPVSLDKDGPEEDPA